MKATYLITLITLLFFGTVQADNYYWIGGSGNWSEISHWATTSGGSIYHGVIPNADDNVFFDENSFSGTGQIVTIDPETAYCKNITFANVNRPIINGNSTIEVNGSLVLATNMSFNHTGIINLNATSSGMQLITAGNYIKSELQFKGANSEWTIDKLQTTRDVKLVASNMNINFDNVFSTTSINNTGTGNNINFGGSLYVAGSLSQASTNGSMTLNSSPKIGVVNISSGTFDTNSNDVSCNSFISTGSNNRVLKLGSSDFVTKEWNISSTNLDFTLYPNTITLTDAPNSFSGGQGLAYDNIIFQDDSLHATFTNASNAIQNIEFNADATINGSSSVIQNMQIAGNATFNGSNTYTNLLLTGGKTYIFKKETKQTITNQLQADGSCAAYTFFSSDEKYKTAAIEYSGAAINYIIIKDIEATSPITANNATGISKTPNWAINTNSPKNLYWVGGEGNWNDPQNWSETSGGSGGSCVPSPADNTYFDNNSFTADKQAVTLDVRNSFCHDMIWSQDNYKSELKEDTILNHLRIFGSLQLNKKSEYNSSGPLHFEATTAGNTITTAGQVLVGKKMLNNDIEFNGIGGEWTLLDSLNAGSNNIKLSNGLLNTNSKKLNCINFSSLKNEDSRQLILGASELNIKGSWTVNSEDFILDAGTSIINMEKGDAVMTSGDDLTYYDVHFLSKGTLNGANTNFRNVVFDQVGTIQGDNKTIDYLLFNKNGYVNENQTYGVLSLSPSYTYEFEYTTTQTITSTLIASGGCSAFVYLKSSNAGSPAFFSHDGGEISTQFLQINDIHAIGSGKLSSSNLLEAESSNYDGWDIVPGNELLPRTLYWVGKGNSKNWSNSDNWSLISGGEGGECLPNKQDDVIFDENSFATTQDSVIIDNDIKNAECKTMDWTKATNKPTLINESENIDFKIYGSFLLHPQMNFEYKKPIYFVSDQEKNTINLANNSLLEEVYFNSYPNLGSKTGMWNLEDSLSCHKNIYLNVGTLNTGGHHIKCLNFYSKTQVFSHLNLEEGSELSIVTNMEVDTYFKISAADDTKIIFVGINNSINIPYFIEEQLTFPDIEFKGNGDIDISIMEQNVIFRDILFNTSHTTEKTYNANINIEASEYVYNMPFHVKIGAIQINENGKLNLTKAIVESVVAEKNLNISNSDTKTIKTKNIFGNVELKGSSYIYDENIFDTLKLGAGRTYTLESEKTQEIQRYMSFLGNACTITQLQASGAQRATLNGNAGAKIEGFNANIYSIDAIGQGMFFTGKDGIHTDINPKWIEDDPIGYIYGFTGDKIYDKETTPIINTDNFNINGDATYSWKNTNNEEVATGDKFPVKDAGKYTLLISFSDGCDIPDAITVYFTEKKEVSCKGMQNGSMEIFADPNLNYSYNWTADVPINPAQQDKEKISNLQPGNYSITVTDLLSNKATTKDIGAITEPTDELSFTTAISNNICYSPTAASLTIDANGGTPLYSFYINEAAMDNGNQQYGLATNTTYNLKVVDNNSCTTTDEVIITSAPQIVSTLKQLQEPLCHNSNEGKISIEVNRPATEYTIEVDGTIASSSIIENLNALHNYQLTVTDKEGCTTTNELTIKAPSPISITYETVQNPTCFNSENGIIKITATGGTGTSNLLTTSAGTINGNTIEQLAENENLQIMVADNNGCKEPLTAKITVPEKLTATATQTHIPECSNTENGELSINTKGGTAPYQFFMDSSTEPLSSVIKNLKPRTTYNIKVIDVNGCETTSSTYITAPALLTFNVVQTQTPACYNSGTGRAELSIIGGNEPYTIKVNNSSQDILNNMLPHHNYLIEVFDTNTCSASDNFKLSLPEAISVSVEGIGICGNNETGTATATVTGGTGTYIYSWNTPYYSSTNTAYGLLPDIMYHLTVTDKNNCSTSDEVMINASPDIIVKDQKANAPLCTNSTDGSIELTVEGGTPPLLYTINEAEEKLTTAYFSNLSEGAYLISISDKNNCTLEVTTTLTAPLPIKVEVTDHAATLIDSNDGYIIFETTGGTGNTSTQWYDTTNRIITDLNNLYAGEYIAIASDQNACADTLTFVVEEFPIEIPNIFTPNNDGINDEFIIECPKRVNFHCYIFNRWGQKMSEWTDPSHGWNGIKQRSNQEAAVGVYFYRITISGNNKKQHQFEGFFHLQR